MDDQLAVTDYQSKHNAVIGTRLDGTALKYATTFQE